MNNFPLGLICCGMKLKYSGHFKAGENQSAGDTTVVS